MDELKSYCVSSGPILSPPNTLGCIQEIRSIYVRFNDVHIPVIAPDIISVCGRRCPLASR